ncbi:MAG: hypothetical protein DWH91_18010 [Planctomycetota bacterium]|nr:MAG: hypothetical protein DWH91_18010 [Planctomycetota bacterium]
MPMDAYAPCPCGSGKKLKFCCQSISPEMEKAERLIDNHQPRMALNILDKLAKAHSQNPWVITRQAAALMSDDRASDAKTALLMFLRNKSDHPSANALYAMATLQADGLPEARKAIRRAFRFSIAAEPVIVAGLAQFLAEYHMGREEFMAARQHLVMALQLANDNQRTELVNWVTELDMDASIPPSFRGGHEVPQYIAPAAATEKVNRAERLASVACWGDAAALLAEVAEQDDPKSVALWHLVGLFRAWDGDEAAAATAFRKASELSTDNFELAVELETLAQELIRNLPANGIELRSVDFVTDSVAKALTQCDSEPRLIRLPVTSDEQFEQPLAANYAIIDRASKDYAAGVAISDLSRIIGRVTVFDADADKTKSPAVVVTGLVGKRLDDSLALARQTLGDLIRPSEKNPPEGVVAGRERPDDAPVTFDYYVPRTVPAGDRRRLRREFLTASVDAWRKHPQVALNGKAPQDLVGNPDAQVQLAASLECFEGVAEDLRWIAPIALLRQSLKLPAVTSTTVRDDQHLQALSLFQLRRVALSGLTDSQFSVISRRTTMAAMVQPSVAVLNDLLELRTQLVSDDNERLSIVSNLFELASRSMDDVAARRWIARGYEIVSKLPNSFEKMAEWKLRDVRSSLEDASRLKSLFQELWELFGAKIPPLRQLLTQMALELGLDRPWESGIVTPSSAGGASLWSPDAGASSSGEQKLWLPNNG